MLFSTTIVILELIASIAGTIYIVKCSTNKSIRLLTYFLWFTFFMESTIGHLPYYIDQFDFLENLKKYALFDNSIWVYNIYGIISGLFYLYFFEQQIRLPWFKKILRVFIFFHLSFYCFSLISNGTFLEKLEIPPILLDFFFITTAIFLYFLDQIYDDSITLTIKLPAFIGIGMLLFNVLDLPILLLQENINSQNTIVLLRCFLLIGCLFLYISITIGFLLHLKNQSKKMKKKGYSFWKQKQKFLREKTAVTLKNKLKHKINTYASFINQSIILTKQNG
ncbi:hypothetical protein [Aquimarina litoralis]|uniref:hypothetical protein n=1 Tax=Aquimarina litoralis TaxID=584605 RepID=UPI001C5A1F8D|nr:hypothetical protein [Aquimarina litoralis]MBW1294688.1 hypothetical protein [Aquimarina litoralis]